jgi:chromosome segregation ATPase
MELYNTMTELEKANATLASLIAKLAETETLHEKAEARIKQIAYDAIACDDAGARKEMGRLEAEAAKAATEITALEAAIATAQKHVTAAQDAERDDVERENARTALGLLSDFAARGERLDHALEGFVREYEALNQDFRALQRLSYPPSTFALIENGMKRATQTKLMQAKLQSDFLAPHQRTTFSDCIEGWAASVRNRIEARLQRKPAKAT